MVVERPASSTTLFVLFLLAIVLSILLRFTDSDCPIAIFKLFIYYIPSCYCDVK